MISARKSTSLTILGVIMILLTTSLPAKGQRQTVGNPIAGGRLYAAWDNMVESDLPLQPHPLWPFQDQLSPTTWRCVSCHGWDYQGIEIILGNIEETGAELSVEETDSVIYPSLLSMFAESETEIIRWLDGTKNPDHDFSALIPRPALKDLSAFLSVGIVAPNLIADPTTREVNGAAAQGEDLYKGQCLQCHGVEGAKINFGTVNQPWFLGNIAENNPWWASHTIRFGHPGGELKAGEQINITFDRHTDLLAYMQILPSAQSRLNEVEVTVDYKNQADTILLTYMAIGLSGVIFGGVGWVVVRERRRSTSLQD